MLTPQQRTALAFPSLLTEEALHPRFKKTEGVMTMILTVNRGYECIEEGFGGPVWHASCCNHPWAVPYNWSADEVTPQEEIARLMLHGAGDASLGEWTEDRGETFHLRWRLTDDERNGMDVRDIRGTPEEVTRLKELRKGLPGALKRVLDKSIVHVSRETKAGTHQVKRG